MSLLLRASSRQQRLAILGLVVVATTANLCLWASTVATPRAVAATQPPKGMPYLVFADGKPFTIAIKKNNNGNFGNSPTATIRLTQVINGMQKSEPWTGVTVTKFATAADIVGIRAIAKRVGGSPPLTGTIMVTVTDGTTAYPTDPINVAELPDFLPCPPDMK